MNADESAPWYRDGLRFTCTRCGNCCTGAPGYVWVDADAMKAFHVDGLPTTYLIDPAGKIAPLDEEAGLEESLSKLLAAP